jgi:plasmid segregation protein ParM
MTVFGQFKTLPKAMVIDIGGYTADYVEMNAGRFGGGNFDSLEHGVIVLYNDIIRKVSADLDILLEEPDIDRLLRGEAGAYPEQVSDIAFNMALAFVNSLAGMLRERGFDLRFGHTVFVGGGAILLKDYLEASEKFGSCIYVNDIAANARGYALMYNAMKG